MAVNRGELSAYNYQIPQQNVALPGQASIAQSSTSPDFSNFLPKAAEGLQHVSGSTKDYYNKWADLRNYAHSMWENYGVDVTKPDFSNPASIEANDLFTKAVADIMYQGDQLKTSQTMLSDLMKDKSKMLKPGFDPSAAPMAQVDPRDAAFSTDIPDAIKQINTKLQKSYYTEADTARANKMYDDAVSYIDGLIQEDPQNADTYQMWKESLTPATKQTKLWKPDDPNSGESRDSTSYLNFAKKVAGTLEGTGGYTPSTTEYSSGGAPMLESDAFRGWEVGDVQAMEEGVVQPGKTEKSIITKFLRNPETKETSVLYENGYEEVLSSNDLLEFAERLALQNKSGYTAKGLRENLSDYITKDGLLPANILIDNKSVEGRNKLESESTAKSGEVQATREAIKDKIKESRSGIFGIGRQSTDFETDSGDILKVYTHFGISPSTNKSTTFYIENDKGETVMENMTIDELTKYLEREGVLARSLGSNSTTEDTPEFDPDI